MHKSSFGTLSSFLEVSLEVVPFTVMKHILNEVLGGHF